MKKSLLLTIIACLCLLGPEASTQENYTEGTVWRVILIDIKPGKNTEFWQDLRRNVKPIWEENKKQGIIMDYAIHVKATTDSPADWDVSVSIQYKNFAALDGLAARVDPITLKAYGSAEARREAMTKRAEFATTVSSFLMRQVTPKDLPR